MNEISLSSAFLDITYPWKLIEINISKTSDSLNVTINFPNIIKYYLPTQNGREPLKIISQKR